MSAGAGLALPAGLAAAVRAWIAEDPDPDTRSELERLLAGGEREALESRFAEPLEFGTAGLRAPLGAGPARMNRLVVRRTTAGVARWLLGRGPAAAAAGLVVGRDARHRSDVFAADVAEVAAALGVRVHVLPQPLPTPLTAFAVLHLGAAAGVMVTASHNPAPDNGYKVYAGDGAQIVPPDDALIAAAAGEGEPPPPGSAPAGGGEVLQVDRQELLDAYAAAALAVLDPATPRRLRVVYTPVHGVGGLVLPELLARAGFDPPLVVASQGEPDPDFPTAPFPNPEEPGVLDPALAEARRRGADLVLANDPDADRLAAAVPSPSSPGGWRVLSGDELGALLGDHLLARAARRRRAGGAGATLEGAEAGGAAATTVVATSIVSSSLLAELAAAAGARFVETLTGFKWIARAADCVPGGRLLFGYEEALGYAVSDAVRDKDGLSAALLAAELAATALEAGRPLAAALDDLAERFGLHLTSQWSLRLDGDAAGPRLAEIVGRWRASPPRALAAMAVSEAVDLGRGYGALPPTPGVLLRLRGSLRLGGEDAAVRARVVVRPSGTEAKLKAYLEVVVPPEAVAAAGLPGAREAATGRLQALREAVAESLAP